MFHDPRRVERVKSFRHMLQNEDLGAIGNTRDGIAIAELKRTKTDIAAVFRPAFQETLLPMVAAALQQLVWPFRSGWQRQRTPESLRKDCIIRLLVCAMSVPSGRPARDLRETALVATTLSRSDVATLRYGAHAYFQEHLRPGTLSRRLLAQTRDEVTLLLNAYRVPLAA